ncbi:MAG: serine hydrolase domain-containing protein [Gemmatimonadales bacterium]
MKPWLMGSMALLLVSGAEGQQQDRAAMVAAIDSLLNTPIKAGRLAGGSVAVIRGKDTLVLKGYGYADLEHDVPTPPNASYEIGSVTKQFTAVAVLQLAQQGKIDLDADITKYLPDYQTQGHKITIRRLLDHTSGIKGITEIPEFRTISMSNVPRDSLVRVVQTKPFDFPPGEQQTYNNSGYFLAGLLVEKVSGMSYADYVAKHLFAPAGMTRSYYCSERTIKKGHAHGYDTDSTGLVLKGFTNHRWPFAAGSLCSTAGDLAAWNQALHHGDRILNRATYRDLVTPAVLNDGTKLRYGMGFALIDLAGRPAISHGGDIGGFASFAAYWPEQDLTVVVLLNSQGPARPDAMAAAIARIVLGPAPERTQTFAGNAADFNGTYTGPGRGRPMTIWVGDSAGQLRIRRAPSAPWQALSYRGGDTFTAGNSLLTFDRKDGKPVRLRMDAGYAHNILLRQVQ